MISSSSVYHFGDNSLISYQQSQSEKNQKGKCLIFSFARRMKTIIEEIKKFNWGEVHGSDILKYGHEILTKYKVSKKNEEG